MTHASVCIPAYNSALFLGEAIESALGQEFEDYELVVCDNASTDPTRELCARYPRVRYLRFESFVGQAANWNRCLEAARGDLIVLLHADDLLRPRFLARAVEAVEADPRIGLVHCAVEHVDETGRESLGRQQAFDRDRRSDGDCFFHRLLDEGCYINPAGVMVRRSVFAALGGYTEEIVWAVDWHMWLRVALHSAAAFLAEPLAAYRHHPLSGTSGVFASARNGSDESWALADVWRHVERTRPDLVHLRPWAEKRVAHRTWCMAQEACRRGLYRAARKGLWRAARISPALVFEARFTALLLATYLGYGWFQRAQARRLRSAHASRSLGLGDASQRR